MTDGFVIDPEALRSSARGKGQAMVEAAAEARTQFAAAATVPSSFPIGLSDVQSRLDAILDTLADAASDGVRIAEDYQEKLLHTADQHEGAEQYTTSEVGGVQVTTADLNGPGGAV